MVRSEIFGEVEAARRLGVPVGAWRWAVATGAVPGPGTEGGWPAAVVDQADAEGVRAALVSLSPFEAADRLTAALGIPLPLHRPAVTASAVADLVEAGLLLRLSGPTDAPVVHADQVAALGRRRDLPALLDHHVLLGPDQAAVRLGARPTEIRHAVRLGWLRPARTTVVDFGRTRGGEVDVSWFRGVDVALLPVVRSVDLEAIRRLGPGRRSPLAVLEPVVDGGTVTLAAVAQIVGVGRAAVVAWRRRHDDFPVPVGGSAVSPLFGHAAVVAWLLEHGKIVVPHTAPSGTLVVRRSGGGTRTVRLDAPALRLATTAEEAETVSGWVTCAEAEALTVHSAEPAGIAIRGLTVPRHTPLAVPGDVTVSGQHDGGRGRLWVELSWRAGLRGEAGRARHALAAPAEGCPCTVQECGGITPSRWCPVHGDDQAPVLVWHPAGGIRCAELSGALA